MGFARALGGRRASGMALMVARPTRWAIVRARRRIRTAVARRAAAAHAASAHADGRRAWALFIGRALDAPFIHVADHEGAALVLTVHAAPRATSSATNGPGLDAGVPADIGWEPYATCFTAQVPRRGAAVTSKQNAAVEEERCKDE